MIEIQKITIQRNNGMSVMESVNIEPKSLQFETGEQVEEFRRKREMKLQWKSDVRHRKEATYETEDDFEYHKPKIHVYLQTRSENGYVTPDKSKKQ